MDGVNVVGLDIDLPSLIKGRDGLSMLPAAPGDATTAFISGDAYRLPFPDGAFDVVICSEVLEHLHEYDKALMEIRRGAQAPAAEVLRPRCPTPGPSGFAGRSPPDPAATPTSPAATCASSRSRPCGSTIAGQGFDYRGKPTIRPRPAFALLVAEVRPVGAARRPPPGASLPPLSGLGPDGEAAR